jgi:hypothetical protein
MEEKSDADRLQYYRSDIYGRASYFLPHCEPHNANRQAAIVATRFQGKSSEDPTSG